MLIQFFGWLGQQTAVLYLLSAIVILGFCDPTNAVNHAAACALSRYMPSFEYLKSLDSRNSVPDPQQLEPYRRYYEMLVEFMPDEPEAHGLLGYCLYYSGKTRQAEQQYRKAVDSYFSIFNFHYNLGIIYWKQKDYPRALEELARAIKTKPLENTNFVSSSRIYFTTLKGHRDELGEEIVLKMREGYRQAYLAFLQCSEATGDYQAMFEKAKLAVSAGMPDQAVFYYYSGVASYHKGEYGEAVYYLDRASRMEQNEDIFRYLGMALQSVGEKKLAEDVLEKAAILGKMGKRFDLGSEKAQLRIF